VESVCVTWGLDVETTGLPILCILAWRDQQYMLYNPIGELVHSVMWQPNRQ